MVSSQMTIEVAIALRGWPLSSLGYARKIRLGLTRHVGLASAGSW